MMNIKQNKQMLFLLFSFTVCLSSCGHGHLSQSPDQSNLTEEQIETLVSVVAVRRLKLHTELDLPGELLAYQNVPIHAKVEGYIKWISVDRGSVVKKGQKMMEIFCPELNEKVKEGLSKLASAESSYQRSQATLDSERSKLVEVQARLDADSLTYRRLQQAAKTPGAIAQNEVDIQQKAVESDDARVESIKQEVEAAKSLVVAERHNVMAAQEVVNALKDMKSYLTIEAPFDGVITERNVHTGSIVAVDAARSATPLVRIQQKDILRLVVAVPESSVSNMTLGQKIEFSVPAFIGKTFYGIVARPGYALDSATRTMPVELNVFNSDGTLEPGMFATVHWLITRPYQSLFVPLSAVDADLKGTFVIRIKNSVAERLTVQKGLAMGSLTEISGDLHDGDLVALKATNELKTGAKVKTKLADEEEQKNAASHSSAGGE